MEVEAPGGGGVYIRGYISREYLYDDRIRTFNVKFHSPLQDTGGSIPAAWIPWTIVREDELRLVGGDDRIWGPFEPLRGLTRLTELSLGDISLNGGGSSALIQNYQSLQEALPGCHVSFGTEFLEMMDEFHEEEEEEDEEESGGEEEEDE